MSDMSKDSRGSEVEGRAHKQIHPSTLDAPALDYCLVLLFFTLGLMCKPMLVTLPFVLLLLDYWPLNRVATVTDCRNHSQIPRRLVLEKLPLFGLAAAAGVATLFAQAEAIEPFERMPLVPCAWVMPRFLMRPIWARCSGHQAWHSFTH